MRSRTPGFIGSRLREAREVRQLTGGVLANLVGVTSGSISSYERGHSTPSPDVFERLTNILNLQASFFFRPEVESAGTPDLVFERSKSAATKRTRLRARHHRTWLREVTQYISRFIELPAVNIPSADGLSPWQDMAEYQIENVALEARRYWGLGNGPISNVTLLCEKHGVVAGMMHMKSAKLDAFSVWDSEDNRPYIMLGEDSQSAFRTRFNVCHELGHLVLHRKVHPLELEDRFLFKHIERQANNFAAAFLTPASTFSADVFAPNLDLFRTLKSRWKVSIKMMIHRARELLIIDQDEARRMYINYNRRGWNLQEPMDDSMSVEEPRLIRRAFETAIEHSILDRSQVEANLPFNQADIEQLANLPYGYLDPDSAYNLAIREAYKWAIGEAGEHDMT